MSEVYVYIVFVIAASLGALGDAWMLGLTYAVVAIYAGSTGSALGLGGMAFVFLLVHQARRAVK